MELELYPNLVPIKGLVLEAYSSFQKVGFGRKLFVIVQAQRKTITLFYSPRLLGVKITRNSFRALYIAPLAVFDAKKYKQNLRTKMEQYDRFNLRYSRLVAEEVLELRLMCANELFVLAKPKERKPVTNVKRG